MSASLLPRFVPLDGLSLSDLEAIRLMLRGGSVIDWHRLNFESREQIEGFLAAQELDLDDPLDRERAEAVKREAISYLRRNFEFPIPKPVENADVAGLLELASGKGHRQLCACTILKVMHIIHHAEAHELLFMLPTSDEEVFHLVEQKVYRIIGGMLAQGFPIVEFIGGRKNKDSLYTKLLSKQEVTAAQIYDKLRFRIVTRSPDDIFPILSALTRHIFPFNYVIPGESTNTLFHFRSYCEKHPPLTALLPRLQLSPDLEDLGRRVDNYFTADSYRVVHFVVDMPVRLGGATLQSIPPAVRALGRIIFVQTEFQIIDQESDHLNEIGDASHTAYKERQKLAVMHRLKVGMAGNNHQAEEGASRTIPEPTQNPDPAPDLAPDPDQDPSHRSRTRSAARPARARKRRNGRKKR